MTCYGRAECCGGLQLGHRNGFLSCGGGGEGSPLYPSLYPSLSPLSLPPSILPLFSQQQRKEREMVRQQEKGHRRLEEMRREEDRRLAEREQVSRLVRLWWACRAMANEAARPQPPGQSRAVLRWRVAECLWSSCHGGRLMKQFHSWRCCEAVLLFPTAAYPWRSWYPSGHAE